MSHAIEQRGDHGIGIGAVVGAGGEAHRAQAALAQRFDPAIGGTKADGAGGRDPIGEEGQHRFFADRRGGQDARARRAALHFAHGQPWFTGEGRERVKAEAAPADAGPVRAVCRAAFGYAIGEGEGKAEADMVVDRSSTHPNPSL